MTNASGSDRLLQGLLDGLPLIGDLRREVPAFLTHHGHPETAAHCAAAARRLAILVGADAYAAERGGWFHDVSAVFPTALDTPLFVADKIAWDQPGSPPYRVALLAALEQSLDAAALVYLQFLWDRRETLGVIHPWLRAAYRQRCGTTSIEYLD